MVQLGLFCLEWPLCNTLPGLLSEIPPPRTLAPRLFALGSAFNQDKGQLQRVGQRDELGSECHTLRAHGLATGGEPVPQPSTSAELIPHPHHDRLHPVGRGAQARSGSQCGGQSANHGLIEK